MATFRARAKNFLLGFTAADKPQVAVSFEITEEGPKKGKVITWYGYFTEETAERTIQSLRNCGWKGTDISNPEGFDSNEVELVVEAEEYQGKKRAKVQWVNEIGHVGVVLKKPMTPDQAKTFAARMKGKVVALMPRTAAPASPAAPTREPGDDSDEEDPF